MEMLHTVAGTLKAGMGLKKDFDVTRTHTARSVGSGGLEVLATPVLIEWVENAAYEMVSLCMADEQTTVGVKVDIDHVAATPVGMKVRVIVTLTEVENRKLTFKVEARDTVQVIATGTHVRYVVNKTKFMEKVLTKREQNQQ